jgi:hypothetical protein
MSNPKPGFDPLASLFDGPDLGEFTDPHVDRLLSRDQPDPLISMRADAPLDVLKGNSNERRAEDLPEPKLPPAVSTEAEEPKAEEAKAEEALHKAALAKSLAMAAIEKAKQATAREAELVEEAQIADEAARDAAAKAAQALKPAPATVAEPAAQSGKTKSGKTKSGKTKGRLDGLANRARRPTSALEAARAASQIEEQRKQSEATAAAEAHERAIPELVESILRKQLRGVERLKVGKALRMDDRVVLRALWKGHRARFAQQGAWAEVVSTTQVIRALDAVAQGQLVAAIVRTQSSDYLVWVDLGSQATIAAFPDAHAWYAANS